MPRIEPNLSRRMGDAERRIRILRRGYDEEDEAEMEAALEEINALLPEVRGMMVEGQEIVKACRAHRKVLSALKRQVEDDLESMKTSWTKRLLEFTVKEGLRRVL